MSFGTECLERVGSHIPYTAHRSAQKVQGWANFQLEEPMREKKKLIWLGKISRRKKKLVCFLLLV